jgi:uroporphyrinogen decarboxylase
MVMTHRERELATIYRQPTDRLPVDAICIENGPQIGEYLGIPAEAVLERLGLDGRIVAPGYAGERRPDQAGGLVGEWGTLETGDYGTCRPAPLASVASVAQIEAYPWPDPGLYAYDAAAEWVRAAGDEHALRGPYWMPLFCRVCDLCGMEQAMVLMLSEGRLFEALLEQVAARVTEVCCRFMEACGDSLAILCLGDDFATQRGLMVSPEHWRRYLKPHYARLFAEAKRRGKPVWFHSCGDVTAVLGDLIEIGADVWETVQLHTLPMSAPELKREFGRDLVFFGGVNTQRLPFISAAEVREEVLRCVDILGAGGGYICGPDHHIKPDVPPANAVALFDAATGAA